MRGVVLGLLLANLVPVIWFLLQPSHNNSSSSALRAVVSGQEAAVTSIALLSEAPEQSLVPYGGAIDTVQIASTGVPSHAESFEVELPGQPQSCVELGPFATRQLADSMIASVAPDIVLELESRMQQLPSSYRVYLAPFGNREAASESLDRLRAALTVNALAIETFLIPRGELANGIALGLFSEQRNALNVKEQVEGLGFSVTIREEPRQGEQLWLFSHPFDFEGKIEPLRSSLAELAPSAQLLEKLCQTIAQDIQLP